MNSRTRWPTAVAWEKNKQHILKAVEKQQPSPIICPLLLALNTHATHMELSRQTSSSDRTRKIKPQINQPSQLIVRNRALLTSMTSATYRKLAFLPKPTSNSSSKYFFLSPIECCLRQTCENQLGSVWDARSMATLTLCLPCWQFCRIAPREAGRVCLEALSKRFCSLMASASTRSTAAQSSFEAST